MNKLVFIMTASLIAGCQGNSGNQVASFSGDDTWQLVQGYHAGKELAIDNHVVTLNINEEMLSGHSSVNRYRLPITLEGNTLHVTSGVMSTRASGSPQEMQLEREYLQALSHSNHIKQQQDNLLITGDESLLEFMRISPVTE